VGTKERRERDRQATRQRILDAARDLFVELGYDALTMRKLAERVEYSPTALYLHFADKEALMTELSLCDFDAFTAAFKNVPDDLDPLVRLRGLGRAYVRFALEHPNQYRLLFMTPRPEMTDEALARKPTDDAYDLLLATVEAARAGGHVDPARDVHETAQILWGSLHGVVALHLVMPKKGRIPFVAVDRLAEAATEVLVRGLCQPEAGASSSAGSPSRSKSQ
jgi:AcrR family transcriptional regulator